MRKKNCRAEFNDEKREFLLKSFRSAIAAQCVIDRNRAFQVAAEAPAPRFWVSETRAAEVVGRMLAREGVRGLTLLPSHNTEKGEMYREIFGRFMRLREERPDASIAELTFEVVNSPAPRSYISWQTVRSLIYDELKERRNKRCR